MGLSIHAAAGLAETLIARTFPDYVKLAVALANDPYQLQILRRGLRQRFLASAWCDRRGVTRKLEAGFREMWRHYVEDEESKSRC